MDTLKIKTFIPLEELEIYKLSRKLSNLGWGIYEKLSYQERKVMGDQFIESTDSSGANIAEGYARFHYLDRIKFCYNARGSLMEASDQWLELLNERGKTSNETYMEYKATAKKLSIKLNNYIKSLYRVKSQNKQ